MIHASNPTAVGVLVSSIVFFASVSIGHAMEAPQIVDGSKVTLSYHITVPGEKLEIRDVGQFVQGRHEVLPALEREITGLKTGDEKRMALSAEEGLGPYDASNKTTVPRSAIPQGAKEGDVLQDRTGKPATITHLSDSSADIDFNHPLAGKAINLEIKILRVDNAAQP